MDEDTASTAVPNAVECCSLTSVGLKKDRWDGNKQKSRFLTGGGAALFCLQMYDFEEQEPCKSVISHNAD